MEYYEEFIEKNYPELAKATRTMPKVFKHMGSNIWKHRGDSVKLVKVRRNHKLS